METVPLLSQLIVLALLLTQVHVEAKSLPQERIINGFNAQVKQFPYQVYLEVYANRARINYCSGVIISERIILTAAHCVATSFNFIEIYFGALDKRNIREEGHQRFIVYRPSVRLHEHWYLSRYLNDIALIKLPIELHFNDYIQPVQLPAADESYENQSAVLSGWGQTNDFNGNLVESNLLQYYNGNVISNVECASLVHRYVPAFLFASSLLCLGPSKSISCYGDSGGPLVTNENGTNILIGLRTNGLEKSCFANSPDLFTRVTSYLNWINRASRQLLRTV